MPSKIRKPTSFHWGSYYAETENEKLVGMRPYENDKDPSSIANGIIDSIDDDLRIKVLLYLLRYLLYFLHFGFWFYLLMFFRNSFLV